MDDTKERFPVDVKSYRILELIGRGPNNVVYKAHCIPMNKDVAIKSFNLDHLSMNLDEILRQATAKFYSIPHHPNILNPHCSFSVDRKIWVVMPLIPAGSLQSIMSSSFPTGLPENCIAVILKQILNLLYYLHSNQILYSELKAKNILIDPKGHIQFASFGLSASISRLSSSRSSPLTIPEISCNDGPYWVAPEVYSVKPKIWSFGILALELAQGRPPLSDIDQYLSPSMIKKIKERICIQKYKCSSSSSCPDKKTFSESFKDLVKQCLEEDPGNRPPLEMLQKHRFIRSCESAGFLAKNMFHDLPSLEDRFKLSKNRYNYMGDEENEKTRQCRITGWKLNVESLKVCPIFAFEPKPDLVIQNETEALEGRRKLHFQFGGGKPVIGEKELTMEITVEMDGKSEKGKGKMDEENEVKVKGKGKMDEGGKEKGKGIMKMDEEDKEKGKGMGMGMGKGKGVTDSMWESMIDRIQDVIFGLDTTGEQLDEMDETKTKEEVLMNLISSRSSLEKHLHEITALTHLHDQLC